MASEGSRTACKHCRTKQTSLVYWLTFSSTAHRVSWANNKAIDSRGRCSSREMFEFMMFRVFDVYVSSYFVISLFDTLWRLRVIVNYFKNIIYLIK